MTRNLHNEQLSFHYEAEKTSSLIQLSLSGVSQKESQKKELLRKLEHLKRKRSFQRRMLATGSSLAILLLAVSSAFYFFDRSEKPIPIPIAKKNSLELKKEASFLFQSKYKDSNPFLVQETPSPNDSLQVSVVSDQELESLNLNSGNRYLIATVDGMKVAIKRPITIKVTPSP